MSAKFDQPLGREVWRWPEFQAFAKRLGVAGKLPSIDLNIFIPFNGLVEITHKYQGDDLSGGKQQLDEWPAVETTTVHNEQFKTFKPLEIPAKGTPEREAMKQQVVKGMTEYRDELNGGRTNE